MQKLNYQECFLMTYFTPVVRYPGNKANTNWMEGQSLKISALGQRISPPCGRANTNVLGLIFSRIAHPVSISLVISG